MQINRLFEIIYVLLHKEKVSTRELAEQLGVSTRTINRDIDTLSGAGIPVYAERGKGGGIRLLPDFVLSKALLNEQEQNEILSALQGLSNIKSGDTYSVLQKVSATFNKTATDWLTVDFSDWSFENNYFDNLKEAILHHKITHFDYFNRLGNKTSQSIEPIQLWFKDKSWYLWAYSIPKQAMRIYKLTRIKNLTISKEHFKPKDAETLLALEAEHEKNDVRVYPEIVFHIDKKMTYRVYDDFSEEELKVQQDGNFIATIHFPEDNWLHGLILSYGRYIEVISPKTLRQTIYTEAQEIVKIYQHEK